MRQRGRPRVRPATQVLMTRDRIQSWHDLNRPSFTPLDEGCEPSMHPIWTLWRCPPLFLPYHRLHLHLPSLASRYLPSRIEGASVETTRMGSPNVC